MLTHLQHAFLSLAGDDSVSLSGSHNSEPAAFKLAVWGNRPYVWHIDFYYAPGFPNISSHAISSYNCPLFKLEVVSIFYFGKCILPHFHFCPPSTLYRIELRLWHQSFCVALYTVPAKEEDVSSGMSRDTDVVVLVPGVVVLTGLRSEAEGNIRRGLFPSPLFSLRSQPKASRWPFSARWTIK